MKKILLIIMVLSILILVGCAEEMSDEEATEVLDTLSDEEFDAIMEEEDSALVGQAYQDSRSSKLGKSMVSTEDAVSAAEVLKKQGSRMCSTHNDGNQIRWTLPDGTIRVFPKISCYDKGSISFVKYRGCLGDTIPPREICEFGCNEAGDACSDEVGFRGTIPLGIPTEILDGDNIEFDQALTRGHELQSATFIVNGERINGIEVGDVVTLRDGSVFTLVNVVSDGISSREALINLDIVDTDYRDLISLGTSEEILDGDVIRFDRLQTRGSEIRYASFIINGENTGNIEIGDVVTLRDGSVFTLVNVVSDGISSREALVIFDAVDCDLKEHLLTGFSTDVTLNDIDYTVRNRQVNIRGGVAHSVLFAVNDESYNLEIGDTATFGDGNQLKLLRIVDVGSNSEAVVCINSG